MAIFRLVLAAMFLFPRNSFTASGSLRLVSWLSCLIVLICPIVVASAIPSFCRCMPKLRYGTGSVVDGMGKSKPALQSLRLCAALQTLWIGLANDERSGLLLQYPRIRLACRFLRRPP